MRDDALIAEVWSATERAKRAYYADTTCPEPRCATRIDHTQARCAYHDRLVDAEKHRRKRAARKATP